MSGFDVTKLSTGGGGRAPLPFKEYDAVVHAVLDMGEHVKVYKGEAKPAATMIKFLFEIPGAEEDGTSRVMGYKELKFSTHEKSSLMGLLKNLFGVVTIDEVLHKLETSEGHGEGAIKGLLGTAVKLTLATFTNKDNRDIQYIAEVDRLDPRLPAPEATLEPFVFITTAKDAPKIFKEKLTPFTQDRIASSEAAGKFPEALQQAIAEVGEEREQTVESKVLG